MATAPNRNSRHCRPRSSTSTTTAPTGRAASARATTWGPSTSTHTSTPHHALQTWAPSLSRRTLPGAPPASPQGQEHAGVPPRAEEPHHGRPPPAATPATPRRQDSATRDPWARAAVCDCPQP
ncbi:uncharacterized protein LOC129553403 [Moschus berezovskii]|uniref:uncharacterized protein LOC129553403 n=1 Tax=Moschus berezovskii TaxID=68408 RepID=UPI0024440C4C|nr:uncharacterized protein LOC129553403 [Moschus berezovskii]